jgi:hypothetical protein
LNYGQALLSLNIDGWTAQGLQHNKNGVIAQPLESNDNQN